MSQDHTRILVVDDEPDIARLISFNLRAARYDAKCAHTGNQALKMAIDFDPALIVLDLMLPDISGKEVCRRLMSDPRTRHKPIIMLTACDTEVDRVVGFELGATDYVTKPFSTRELLLRIGAILRRMQQQPQRQVFRVGDIEIDLHAHRVRRGDNVIALTRSEFDLVVTMLTSRGRVYSRDELLDAVWGDETEVLDRTVDAHIMRLRKKLGDDARHIETVRGVGYRVV